MVPAIGRVMSSGTRGRRRRGRPFWRHGRSGPGWRRDENGWINFGGDKAWPAPQSEWGRMVGKGWPPPRTFDAVAHTATVEGGAIVMLSPVDPAYGLRVRRRISLDATRRCCRSRPRSRRCRGRRCASRSGRSRSWRRRPGWSRLLPERSAFAGGHRRLMPAAPRNLAVAGGRLSRGARPARKDDDRHRRRRAAGVARRRIRSRRSDHREPISRRPRRAPSGLTARTARSTPTRTAPTRTSSWSCWVRCTISRPGRAPRSPSATSCVAESRPGQPHAGDEGRRLGYGQVGNCAVVAPKGVRGFCTSIAERDAGDWFVSVRKKTALFPKFWLLGGRQ